MEYRSAITRIPCGRFAEGLTHGLLGKPDVALAVEQHAKYVEALRRCGVEVTVLPGDDAYPDSCFAEDEAILTDHEAIMPAPCFPSRQGEEIRMRPLVEAFYHGKVSEIKRPGTLEGGDICRDGNHYFIGLSKRTNDEGARQMEAFLTRQGYTCSFCNFREVSILHLSTGMSCLSGHTVICVPEFKDFPAYKGYRVIVTPEDEKYASNLVDVNGHVIMAAGFPKTEAMLTEAGYDIITVPMTEFEKQDGGLSCLSLRIPKAHW